MFGRHGEDVLHEEGVELDDLPKQNELEDGHESHPAAARVQPPAGGPTFRGELWKVKINLLVEPMEVYKH